MHRDNMEVSAGAFIQLWMSFLFHAIDNELYEADIEDIGMGVRKAKLQEQAESLTDLHPEPALWKVARVEQGLALAAGPVDLPPLLGIKNSAVARQDVKRE